MIDVLCTIFKPARSGGQQLEQNQNLHTVTCNVNTDSTGEVPVIVTSLLTISHVTHSHNGMYMCGDTPSILQSEHFHNCCLYTTVSEVYSFMQLWTLPCWFSEICSLYCLTWFRSSIFTSVNVCYIS